ncbi:DNA binding methylated-DNA-cysteine S-methyltransferase [Infundibulicybe gibba]|nr:DNA binding methylated-DNA-cysteine S-methyltransferase [Infundibulicybe gibba]
MDAAEFHASVYETVRQIPPQKVTTYGHIAKLVGMPNHSRHVGQALKFLSPDVHPPIPWYRVVASSGAISSRGPGTDGARRQRDELIAEGVEVSEFTAGGGGGKVNMGQWGWFPDPGRWRESVEEGEEGDEHEG